MPETANLKLPYPVEANPADVPVDIEALAQAMDAYGLSFATPGDLKLSAAIAAPAGWLVCDGRAVSRATYAALYAAIGTSFGAGDGSTTFALPDFRGRSPVGVGQGGGLSARALGAAGGEESHTLANSEMPVHSHGGATSYVNQNPVHHHNTTGYAAGGVVSGAVSFNQVLGGALTQDTNTDHTHNIAADGGGAGHNNMAPFVAVNVLVKT